MKAPNEIWIIDVPNAKYFFKRKMNDTDIKYIRADTLHAPSYDKGYDANKKDYDEVWADLDKAIKQADKANDLIKELVKRAKGMIPESCDDCTFTGACNDCFKGTIGTELITKAKEFLK